MRQTCMNSSCAREFAIGLSQCPGCGTYAPISVEIAIPPRPDDRRRQLWKTFIWTTLGASPGGIWFAFAGTGQSALICGLGTLIGFCLSLPGVSVANVGSGVLGSIVLHNAPRSLHPQVGDFFFGDGPALGHRSTPWAESQIVAVVVNTDEEIQFDEIGQMEFRPNEKILIGGELVRLPDLQQVLESYQGQDRVFIFCSHDSDPAPNSVAVDVVQAILQMGLPLGYIPEASNTIHVAKERIRQTFRNGAAP